MDSGRKWLIAAMLFIGGGISYLDRAALSVLAPLVARDLKLPPASLGVVFSVFFAGYAMCCMAGGMAADRFGPRKVLICAMLLWSLFCGLTGVALSFVSLLVIRLFFGMAEGPFLSTSSKIICNWFPVTQRSTGLSIAMSGTTLGGAIAGPIAGYLAISHGWRVSFAVIALFGVVWTVGFMFVAKDTPDHSPLSRLHTADVRSPDRMANEKTVLSYIGNPAVLATAVGYFGFAYLLYFFLSWFPSYLTMERHLSLSDMSAVSIIPWVMGFFGYMGGGLVTDALCRKTGRALYARKMTLVTSLLVAGVCVALAGHATTATMAAGLMGFSVFFLYVSANCYFAIILDMVEASRVGAVGGFIHMIANFAGVLAPVITGFIVQATGSFTSAFLLAGGVALVGSVSVAVLVPRGPKARALYATGQAART
ncbi:MFS transporter [Paraburkholderia solisilvae]|uniref:Hexuronate transporter n=2 Tax=Paraburkholderia solisilvae TaxID=624376 RepID=A0A6J5DCX1_9BURK|nr:Hexuronate transporter [Paraburkholderia solisilvae]